MFDALVLTLCLFAAAAPAPQAAPASDRETAIREVVKAYVDARETIDPARAHVFDRETQKRL